MTATKPVMELVAAPSLLVILLMPYRRSSFSFLSEGEVGTKTASVCHLVSCLTSGFSPEVPRASNHRAVMTVFPPAGSFVTGLYHIVFYHV